MSQPLYFLPGIDRESLGTGGKLSRDVLQSRGLATVFADVQAIGVDAGAGNITHGPDGRSGCILYYVTPDGKIPQNTSYVPQAQTWHKRSDGVYIGLANDSPVTAHDLARKRQFPGYWIDLHEQQWLIPVIRRVDDSTSLPRDCYFENGQLVEPIKDEYREYWNDVKEVSDWFFADRWQDFTKPRALILSVRAMSINYRFGLEEQTHLRIVDSESLLSVLMAAVDVPSAKTLEDAQKKTPSPLDSENTTPGPQDC